MTRSIRPLLAALACTLTPPLAAQVDFGGLAGGPGALGQGSESSSPLEVAAGDSGQGSALDPSAHPASTRWSGAATSLNQAADALDQALEAYGEIRSRAPQETYGVGKKFFYSDLASYRQAVTQADRFGDAMKTAYGQLKDVEPRIAGMETTGEPAWALEARTEWTRLVTVYDQLYTWGTRRDLKYDTLAWGDEQKRPLMSTAWQVSSLDLPSSPGVRRQTRLLPSQAAPISTRQLDLLDEALAEAEEARQMVERERIAPASAADERRTLGGWIDVRFTTTSIFDSFIRPQTVRFGLAMTRAKAALNGAMLATEAPSDGRFDDPTHTRLRLAMLRYAKLAWWGDYRFLRVVSGWGVIQRTLYVFDGSGFRNQHRLDTGGIESEHLEDVLRFTQFQGRASTVGE